MSVFDELDDRTSEPTGTDYAPWWDVDEEPDTLVGILIEVHDGPDQYTPEGEIPDPVYTIVSVGRGGFDAGTSKSTRTHSQLLRGLDDAELGDLVQIKYQGLEKVNGNAANSYHVGIIAEEEWQNSDQADEIEEVLDNYNGPEGDNRTGEPKQASESSSSSESSDSVDPSDDQAVEFLADLVDMQDGELEMEQAEKMLNDVREFGVDVEATAIEAGLQIDGDIIRQG